MKTGVILEINQNRALVLDGSGGFREVSAQPGWQTGDVVPLSATARPRVFFMAAACFLVCFLGLGGWLWFGQASLVSLDVNPSVELRLNYFDRVVSARAMNDEGVELLEAGEVTGMTADQAVSALLKSDFLSGYLTKEQLVTVMLTVQSGSGAREEKLLQLVNGSAEEAAEAAGSVQVECHIVDGELVAQAHGHGVTAGKYLALLQLQQADPEIDINDYTHCGIGEIRQEAALCQSGGHQSGKGHHGWGHHGNRED